MIKRKAQHSQVEKAFLLVLVFFFLSGITGLVYEILWTRMIANIIGGAPFAVSIVLTVFMGGLGLGSFIASRFIDRLQEPFRLVKIYGILELIIGAYALVIPALLVAFKPLQAMLYNQLFSHFLLYNILTFLSCTILLILPVICMGATLPILCRFYVTRLSHLGTHAGRLYGLNAIGAAAGALLSGFWLLYILGERGTLIVAVFINVIIGVTCQWIYHKAKRLPVTSGRRSSDPKKPEAKELSSLEDFSESPKVLNASLVIFAVSGFCAMAYEVIWTKLLGLVVGPTTYSFTIVLATFITGLALGSMLFGQFADRMKRPIWLLLGTQITACLFALGISQFLGNSQLFFAKLIFSFRDNFTLLSLSKAVVLFGFMVLPTLCLGAAFPLVGKIYTQSVSRVGRSIGLAYAVNTLGAVLGSFCAGFLLIPLIGKENSLSIVIGLQLLTSLVIAVMLFGMKRENLLKTSPLAVSALIGLFLCYNFPSWNHKLLSSGKYHRFEYIESAIENSSWFESIVRGPEILSRYDRGEVLYYGEGIGGFTSVIKTPDPFGNLEYSLANSGKMDASSRGDMKTQTLLAHFPLLFHEAAKEVMVLGLASGITAGEVLLYPIELLDVLEINQQVVKASKFFLPWNNNVLAHPKTNLIIQDARAHLQLTKQKYDVIISEPSNPWMAGLAALYTSDFFMTAKKKLNQGGIFVQWIHSYNMDWPTFALIGRTYSRVFPESVLVSTGPFPFGRDYLLVGFKGKKGLILENAKRNLPYIKQSKNVALADPGLLYKLIVSEDIKELFGHGAINTNNRSWLEYAAPKLMYHGSSEITEKLKTEKWLSPETRQVVHGIEADIDAQIGFASYFVSLYSPFRDMVNLHRATSTQKQRFFELIEAYCSKNPIDYTLLRDDGLVRRCRSIQIQALESKIDHMPDKASSYYYLANLYYESNMLDKAITNYSKLLRLQSDNFYAHNNLGYALMLQNRYDEAEMHFREALRIKQNFAQAHRNLGYVLAAQDELGEAAKEYKTAIRMLSENHTLHNDLGVILARLGRYDEAEMHFKEALRIKPDFAPAQKNLELIRRKK